MTESTPAGSFSFEVVAQDGRARAGVLHTPHGDIPTPVFAPVGTQATVKTMPPRDLAAIPAPLILANTYHLHLRPGSELVRDMGGLHRFMGWDGPILTDSGGFQVFSLTTMNHIDDDGVTFKSHIDGSRHRFTPEVSMQIQENLGADIIMAFDQCPAPTDRAIVERAVARTSAWMARCREAHPDDSVQALFGIVQGGIFPDLREQSARAVTAFDTPGYAIGGLAVGEGKAAMYETVASTTPLLPHDRPRYLMGVGDPDDLVEAVARGVDIFDCVMPTRLARHGSALTPDGRLSVKKLEFSRDERPLQADCDCYCCQTFTRAYLRHLFKAEELLGFYLLTLHNVTFLIRHVERIRAAILNGDLETYAREFLNRYLGRVETRP
ncbi:MAG: tRNA guanosine(34) transglycosylase Tgt [Chloroflexi bacterium]|nr:tRNA guanosine(34) transglycosylase Tgt [Chloroflexota bacterium]MBV6436288.1 Queuine tRNA-ribosyltransferase [Anaerolineae bacterium]MDL1914839.1 tRNA guanosine(34) transglycosylase Tgt [Anaerolineae bacterium CFX4]MBW7878410.1 tRNA guanosine(34) transglycosylase Tgt [Anaerolineae bacterium]MCC6564248.1 tRNA guanosine(34) transglycosylase Tgt [Chloroflexota bacterium]